MHPASLALIGLLACANTSGPPTTGVPRTMVEAKPGEEAATAHIIVDATRPESGRLTIEMSFTGVSGKSVYFREMGKDPEITYHDVQFWGSDGDPISHTKKKRLYKLDSDPGPAVHVRYTVEPGGQGRHGHQGMVDKDFAVWDGRVYLMPKGVMALRDARIKYLTPDGWVPATPFRKDGDWYHTNTLGPDLTSDTLASSCQGVGPFDLSTETFGETEVRVYTYSGWNKAHKDSLNRKSKAVWGWFHNTLGFDLHAPYISLWTPKTDNSRLFGGSHGNGTCMEHPKERVRNFQLLTHRIGHSMNKYNPSGMHIRDQRDHWFLEGWASYTEVVGTYGAGIVANESYWNSLYDKYLNAQARHPEWDLALIDEHTASGDTTEYIHYTKGPLVVKMLDVWLEQEFDADLEAFMKAMWAKHGQYKTEFDLRDELDAWVGASTHEFWEMTVDQRGFIPPVWPEARTPKVDKALNTPAAGTVDGERLSGDYIAHLAESGDFARFTDIASFLREETPRRRALIAAGKSPLPTELHDAVYGLAPGARYALARHEKLRSPGTPDVMGDLQLTQGDPDADAFAAMLAFEAKDDSPSPSSGVSQVFVRVGDKSGPKALAVGENDDLLLYVKWNWPPPSARYVLYQDGEQVADKSVTVQPGWSRSWATFEAGDREDGNSVMTFEVQDGEKLLARRVFWQR